MTNDPRMPTEHGKPVSEVVDLGGPVARITRTTYVNSQWTTLVLMVPSDSANGIAGGSVEISLSATDLERFIKGLTWPV